MDNSSVAQASVGIRRSAPPDFITGRDIRDRLREGFGTEVVALRHRLTFLGFAAALCVIFAITYIHADALMTPLPAFIPSYITSVIVTELITAYLLFVHTPLSRRFDLLWVAGAYLFSSAMACGQLIVLPGALSLSGLFRAGPQGSVWIWIFWHSGFPAMVMAAMAVSWRQRQGATGLARPRTAHCVAMAALVLGLAAILVVLVAWFHADLPVLVSGVSYGGLTHSIAGHVVIALNLAALVVVLRVTRGRTVLDLGIALAVLASTLDAALTLKAGIRFSIGWYIARAISVVTAVTVLIVFLREVTLLYARVLRLNERLAEQAAIDATTELFNRRHFNRQLHLTLRDAARRNEATALLLIDIDHFKLFNDRYGHLAGDECLHQVAQAIVGAIRRPRDTAARYGGEEFAVILPSTSLDGARHIAQRVLAGIRALSLDHAASPTTSIVSVSIGVGLAKPGMRSDELIRESDDALYAAKREGRDRVEALTVEA
ncbi:diguanylate cyclase domain-containing protein [Acidisoma sp.]|uniref:GGDEF domain-containing protein n=1 Tax=Acidisoma sp. TaxID=1872115 RepID=UPI003B00149F